MNQMIQDLKFEPRRSEAEHATSRSGTLSAVLNRHEWAGKKHFVSLKSQYHSGGGARMFRRDRQSA